jgi:hypothetical protein
LEPVTTGERLVRSLTRGDGSSSADSAKSRPPAGEHQGCRRIQSSPRRGRCCGIDSAVGGFRGRAQDASRDRLHPAGAWTRACPKRWILCPSNKRFADGEWRGQASSLPGNRFRPGRCCPPFARTMPGRTNRNLLQPADQKIERDGLDFNEDSTVTWGMQGKEGRWVRLLDRLQE